jgi:hypothetical protein
MASLAAEVDDVTGICGSKPCEYPRLKLTAHRTLLHDDESHERNLSSKRVLRSFHAIESMN